MNPATLTNAIARSSLQSGVAAGNVSRLACRGFRYLITIPNTNDTPANPTARHASRLTTTPTPKPTTTLPRSQPFSTTPHLFKKGGKAAREEKASAQKDSGSATAEDPSDFSALEADIAAAVERLKDDLSKLRAGGRFNPEVLENLRVQPEKSSAEKVKLGDLAQVVPKGRTVQVLVGEKDVSMPPVLLSCLVSSCPSGIG